MKKRFDGKGVSHRSGSERMERKIYLDVLRALACCMVVGVHVSAQCITSLGTSSISFKFMNGMDCFFIVGVPLFVMISGALLLDSRHEDSIKKLYRRNILHLIIAYMFWLLFYNLVDYIKAEQAFSFVTFKEQVVFDALFGNGPYHMWFIPMMLGIYIITPFLKEIVKTRKNCEYFLIVYFVFNLLASTLLRFDIPHKTIVQSLFTRIPLFFTNGYVGYFVLGYYLDQYFEKISKKAFWEVVALGGVSFIWEVTICNAESAKNNALSTILNDPLTVNVFFVATALFVAVKYLLGHVTTKNRFYKVCFGLGKYSFGVYLAHPFVLDVFTDIGINTLLLPVPVSIPLMTVAVTGISYGISYALAHIPLVGKHVV